MMHQDSLEPAAIRFTLERLQESARLNGEFLYKTGLVVNQITSFRLLLGFEIVYTHDLQCCIC